MATGVIVFAHGSSVESANEAVRIVARTITDEGGFALMATSFLDGGKPDLRGAVEDLLGRGADRILVVPYFLTVGLHLKRDLPELIAKIQAERPGLPIAVTPPLDGHPGLGAILLDRAKEGVAQWRS
ncbi:sirohydrochlorin chelatase [Bryobacter aggregatus]|uniref:sirohydrochlorin chelatase n=1 Tax=Bryobacter aggregatus TaxID=360054 RepID=UPI0009B5CB7F|nr:CbiX/SirB N-terminal domain-containing protein [Bryobacter aggregatus]